VKETAVHRQLKNGSRKYDDERVSTEEVCFRFSSRRGGGLRQQAKIVDTGSQTAHSRSSLGGKKTKRENGIRSTGKNKRRH